MDSAAPKATVVVPTYNERDNPGERAGPDGEGAILRLRVRDATAGFKAWHAATLRAIDVDSVRSNGYAFQVEMNYRVVSRGLRIAEVPIRFEERNEGVSKMSLAVQLESALAPWKLRFGRRP